MKDRPRQYNGVEIALGRLAVYPKLKITPVVEVFPAGRAEPFTARIYRRNKSGQDGNPTFQARVLGENRDISLGAGTAVIPIAVFDKSI